jgi:hypothetical protein
MERLPDPPTGQCLAAWDDEVIIVSPPPGWEDQGVAAAYTSLPLSSYGYLRHEVRLTALTPRSPFIRLFAPARRGIADEEVFFPLIRADSYLGLLETLWEIRSCLLREPVVVRWRGGRGPAPPRRREC